MTCRTWAKAFWKEGSNFLPVWAVPAWQWPAAIHTIDFNSFRIGPLYPFQNEFWSLNWNIQLWAALAQEKASLRRSCALGQYAISDWVDSSLWPGFLDGNGIHGSQHQQGLSSWFSLLLEVHTQAASPSQARGLLSPPALQRDDFCKAVPQGFTIFPTAGHKARGWWSYGAVNLPGLVGEQLRDELSSALLERRAICRWCVSARCLSWTDNFTRALFHTYKEGSANQPPDEGRTKAWMVGWYLRCAYKCLV